MTLFRSASSHCRLRLTHSSSAQVVPIIYPVNNPRRQTEAADYSIQLHGHPQAPFMPYHLWRLPWRPGFIQSRAKMMNHRFQSSGSRRPWEPTEKQLACIARNGLAKTMPSTHAEAKRIISRFVSSRRRLEPTPAQRAILTSANAWNDEMDRGEAFDAIAGIIRMQGEA